MASERSTPSAEGLASHRIPPQPAKLHGRAFYESIGSPKFILAPMVDQSEFAWRMLSRSFMAPGSATSLLAYTPMFHARMFRETAKFRDKMFQPLRSSLAMHPDPSALHHDADLYLDGNPKFDRPLFVQFCANDPDEFLEAARYVAPFCDAVDLNLGCPQGIARSGKYGAFLQEDQDLIYRLINKLHRELPVPVTAKIRILETKEKTLAYARNVLDAGASILTVHGRQREAKGHRTGLADWTFIRYLRDHLPKETVLFANGNILRHEDIDICLEQTGADGVMSAEGNLHDPSIFGEAPAIGEEGREFWRGKDGQGGWRMDAAFRRYMDIIYTQVLGVACPPRPPLFLATDPPPEAVSPTDTEREEENDQQRPRKRQKRSGKVEKVTSPNLVAMQAHLFRMLRPLVSTHHDVRDALARCRAGDMAAFEAVLGLVERAVAAGLRAYEATAGRSVAAYFADLEAGAAAVAVALRGNREHEAALERVRACRRPWWVCQAHVRPLPVEAVAKGSLTLSKKEKARLEGVSVKSNGQGIKTGEKVGRETVWASTTEKELGAGGEEIVVPKSGLLCG